MAQVSKPSPERGKPQSGGPSAKVAEAGGSGPATADNYDPWLRASQVALIGLFIIALLWGAYIAQPVIVPLLLAWVIATIVLPVVEWIEERGVPRVIAVIIVACLLLVLIASLIALLTTPLAYWLSRATEFGAVLKQKLHMLSQPLAILNDARKSLNSIATDAQPAFKIEEGSATLVSTIFAVLTPAVSQFILFIGALVFYLVYQKNLRSSVVLLLGERETRLTALRTLTDIDENMTVYFGTFTIVNLCLAFATALMAWLVGLPNPLLLGVLAGVMNFVPYIGPGVVVVALAIVGLLTYPTLGEAAVPPLIFLGMTTIEGQFITPAIMGHRLTINPFAVFISIAFCTWLWGPVGAFLAVPLLVALTVALGHAFAEEKPELPE